MIYKRNYSLANFSDSKSLRKKSVSISIPKSRSIFDQIAPEPLNSAFFNPKSIPKQTYIPKPDINFKSVHKLNDFTNKLLRKFTNIGPKINFSAISITNKLNNFKVINTGGISALELITKRQICTQNRRNSLLKPLKKENITPKNLI